MPRTAEANRQLREEQRAKILQAARKVFARKGLAATMADVAAEAGISYGLTYLYFPSKGSLFQALVEQMLETGLSHWREVLERPGTPRERLVFLISRLVENRRESPELARLFAQVLGSEETPTALRELAAKHGRAFQSTLKRLLVEAQEAGEVVREDPDQLATALLAYLEGLTSLGAWDPHRLRRHFPEAGIILRILGPGGESPLPNREEVKR